MLTKEMYPLSLSLSLSLTHTHTEEENIEITNNHSPVSKFPAPQREGSAMVKADGLSASWTRDSEKLVLSNVSFEVNKVSGQGFQTTVSNWWISTCQHHSYLERL